MPKRCLDWLYEKDNDDYLINFYVVSTQQYKKYLCLQNVTEYLRFLDLGHLHTVHLYT